MRYALRTPSIVRLTNQLFKIIFRQAPKAAEVSSGYTEYSLSPVLASVAR